MGTNSNHHHRSEHGGIFLALLLILAGMFFILFDMEIIPLAYKPVIFSWPMLLVILGLYFLLKHNIWAIVLIGVGILFLLERIPGYNFEIYWPFVLIIMGIIMVIKLLSFKSKRRNSVDVYFKVETKNVNTSENKRTSVEQTNGDKIDKDIAFGSCEQIVFSQDFQGGEVNVAFGELKLDLRKAKLAEINYLEANVCFGNIELYVPAEWKINLKSESFFGNIQDERNLIQQNEGNSQTTLLLKAAAFFGNIEIKY